MKGIVYKIECLETGEVYYGSTQKTLHQRIANHKSQCKYWLKGKTNFITSFQIIERGNYSYVLLETIEYQNKEQLEAREGWYIRNNVCINKYIPTRTDKEYYEDNKIKIKAYQNTYRETNQIKIKESKRNYYLKTKAIKLIKENLLIEVQT